MSTLQQKITRHTKRLKQTNNNKKNPEFEETKLASEPESDMAGMLELSDQDYFFLNQNLRILNGKVDNMQEQMNNVSTEMKIFREKK